MKIQRFILNTFLLLIVIYFAQGPLYAEGSIISQMALLIILAISGTYFIRTLLVKNNKDLFYKTFTLFLLLNLSSFIFTGFFSNPIHVSQIKIILLAALPFYPIYYFTQKGLLEEKDLIRFFFIIYPVIIANFYYSRTKLLNIPGTDDMEMVNNAAYTFTFILPSVFLFKHKKVISSIIMIVLLFFIIQGAKRGALIAGIGCAFFFAYHQLKSIEKKNRIKGYLFVTVGIVALSISLFFYYMSNEYLVERMSSISEGQSSGRNVIYSDLFNAWFYSDNLIHVLFGRGFNMTLEVTSYKIAAHNDWLELLTNTGLLGVSIYLMMFIAAIRYSINPQIPKDKRFMMMAILTIWLFTSAFSMNYTSSDSIYQNILLAFLFGSYKKNKIIKHDYVQNNQIQNQNSN